MRNKRLSKIINVFLSTWMCIALSLLMGIVVVLDMTMLADANFGLMVTRTVVVFLILLIATLSFASKRHSLFIKCIFVGILCLFLYQIWMLCNYIWISSEGQAYAVEILSTVGFYLFLFTASYGALDSLADDGSRTYRKYRLVGMLVAAGVTAVWIAGFWHSKSIHILIIGISLTLLAYIAMKQLIIPDIENGFVRTLRPYNFLVLLLVLAKLFELAFYGVESMSHMLVFSRLLSTMFAIWLFPLAIRGVNKWR